MLAITSDEESGGFKGAEYLANEYKLSPNLLGSCSVNFENGAIFLSHQRV